MHKRAGAVFRATRGLHTTSGSAANAGRGAARRQTIALSAAATVAVVGSTLWLNSKTVHNDALLGGGSTANGEPALSGVGLAQKLINAETLYSLVWGSNREENILPGGPTKEPIHDLTPVPCLENVALRDLQLHRTYAACVDARGDVYQWGHGFYGSLSSGFHRPKLTLKGKNIVQLRLTEDKVYALSASGKIYTLSSRAMKQTLGTGHPTPSSDSWWGTSWLWGEDPNVDFVELATSENLGWGESFKSLAAGDNHLLALTSKGRIFAHPVNKLANQFGQLGFRKFDIPDPAAAATKKDTHLHVDLIPKAIADPYGSSTRSARVASTESPGADLANIDDTNIRFCPKIFEVPVLKGIECVQIAAGGRTSFVRTKSGRVLAWGANEFGQLGLGANVALDTITVPTEVVLWRFIPKEVDTKCINVTAGGDLTAFTVERFQRDVLTATDVLMSGNGQFGGLGCNVYTTSQGNPTTVKAISGLVQYNDKTKKLDPIIPSEISISPTGHVLAALNSCENSQGVGGKDVMVWGRNRDFELGNGKCSSLAVPTNLGGNEERLMLMTRRAKEVKDLHGNVWKKDVLVEQHVAAGYENSCIYWKIK